MGHNRGAMAKTLYLLRHGKSSWADPDAEDTARPLTKRGRKDARRMGQELGRRGARPDLVLCSTARRTRETFDFLCEGLGEEGEGPPPVRFEEGLYAAHADDLLTRIRGIEDDPPSALLIGHNPGMHELARGLAGGGAKAPREKLEGAFPTAALAVIEFPIGAWAEAAPHGGRLRDVVLPRELD